MTEQAKPAGSATFTLGDASVELPVLAGSTGPDVVDIRKLYGATGAFTFDPGFTSTASCESALTYIDGDEGVLLHRGYPIDQLASQSNFLEVCHLLLHGELPTASQFETFEQNVTRHTMLHAQFDRFFEGFRRDAHPMAIMVGAEGPGLTEHAMRAADVRAKIPMQPGTDSLNVATAAAIALYERQRGRMPRGE